MQRCVCVYIYTHIYICCFPIKSNGLKKCVKLIFFSKVNVKGKPFDFLILITSVKTFNCINVKIFSFTFINFIFEHVLIFQNCTIHVSE